MKRQVSRVPELEAAIRNLESLLEVEKERNQALQNALAAQYGMKPVLSVKEKTDIINDCFRELAGLDKKYSYTELGCRRLSVQRIQHTLQCRGIEGVVFQNRS